MRHSAHGAAAVGMALALAACDRASHGAVLQRTPPSLVAVLGAERVRDIGRTWMRNTPSERTARALEAALTTRLAPFPWGDVESVERAVANDFAAGRTVLIDGWLLAVSEARHCALFALSASLSSRAG